MKRLILILSITLLSLNLQAQRIQNNSTWFDGEVLYRATVDGDAVYMQGKSEYRDDYQFTMTRNPEKEGFYTIDYDDPQLLKRILRVEPDWEVQYIRQEGMYFLLFFNDENEPVWLMYLTPDSLEHNVKFQRDIEKYPPDGITSDCLLNIHYFDNYDVETLALMRNEIYARNGYNFSNRELKEYFENYSWYSPVEDNSTIQLSIIEQANIALIKSEEKFKSLNSPEQEQIIEVSNEYEFLSSLGSNRTIVIKENTHLNFSNLLNMPNILRDCNIGFADYVDNSFFYYPNTILSEEVFDGRQLTMIGINNLKIVGEYPSSIVVDPRYAVTLNFLKCENITIQNLTVGHTETGNCIGSVISLRNCKDVNILNCDLFGCGTWGIEAYNVTNLIMDSSIIRDCSHGIMVLNSVNSAKFFHSDFYRNNGAVVADYSTRGIHFDNCRFTQNGSHLFIELYDLALSNCDIHYSSEFNLSVDESILQHSRVYYDNADLDYRPVGPTSTND